MVNPALTIRDLPTDFFIGLIKDNWLLTNFRPRPTIGAVEEQDMAIPKILTTNDNFIFIGEEVLDYERTELKDTHQDRGILIRIQVVSRTRGRGIQARKEVLRITDSKRNRPHSSLEWQIILELEGSDDSHNHINKIVFNKDFRLVSYSKPIEV